MDNVAPEDFKHALAAWASGVTVLSTRVGNLMYGITVSSFSSLSLDPPLILVCPAKTNRIMSMIQESRRFAVSVLSLGQDAISNYFAQAGREPSSDFVDSEGLWTANDLPAVRNAAAVLACELYDTVDAGDHHIAIGRVVQAFVEPDAMPLVYFKRKYRGVTA